jgi:hypothetical protein
MRYKKDRLVLTVQNEHIDTIPIDASKESMITIINNYSADSLAVYIDTNCHVKHGTVEAEVVAKSANSSVGNLVDKDKNKMTLQKLIVYGKVNRAIPFYLFGNGTDRKSFCGKAAQFRIFGWALDEQDVVDIYENSRLLINTAAETRYIGEFVTSPESLNLYDTFKYAGETNDTFLKDKKYVLVQNEWQIWED